MRFQRPGPLMTRPSVSVVIPCYNYGHFLPAAVRSALDHEGVDVQVLIVDDASPDGSASVAQALALTDSRVDVLLHERNAGHIQTYNDGLAKATGDYLVLLSADDMLPRNSLTRAVALLERNPGVGMVYGYARSFTDAHVDTPARTRSWSVWPGRQWLKATALTGRCFVTNPEAVFRREALLQTDMFDPRLPHSGDFDLWMTIATRWDIARVNGPVQAHYRVHDANMHLTTYAGWLTDLEARRRTFEILFDERAPDDPAVTGLRGTASRALAREALRRARVTHRDEPGSPLVGQLIAFAEETAPGARSSVSGRATDLLVSRSRPRLVSGLSRQTTRVRDHLAWRRERRYGL